MTIRELYSIAEQHGALDYDVLMNCNLEPLPVARALIIPDMQIGDVVLKNIVVLDN